LGLLVSDNGYSLNYDVFEGNKYEGDTLLPVIEYFEKKHKPEQLIIVADAGFLPDKKIQIIIDKNYQCILRVRIKNENELTQEQILSTQLDDNQSTIIDRLDVSKLILSYKKARVLKDKDY
jgi:transposase